MPKITYKEVLDIGNDFMDGTGLRRYCQEVCGGDCCHYGNASKTLECNKTTPCHEKLPCVVYTCRKISNLIIQAMGFTRAQQIICDWKYRSLVISEDHNMGKVLGLVDKYHKGVAPVDRYFTDFKVPKQILFALTFEVKNKPEKLPSTVKGIIKRHVEEVIKNEKNGAARASS